MARITKENCSYCKVLAAASVAVSPGDLMWLDSTVAKPASSFTPGINLAASQGDFHDLFLGVSLDERRSDDTSTDKYILVATKGTYEVPVTATTAKQVGIFYGPAESSTEFGLENQKCVNVATASSTSVKIEICSTLAFGGPRAVVTS